MIIEIIFNDFAVVRIPCEIKAFKKFPIQYK